MFELDVFTIFVPSFVSYKAVELVTKAKIGKRSAFVFAYVFTFALQSLFEKKLWIKTTVSISVVTIVISSFAIVHPGPDVGWA